MTCPGELACTAVCSSGPLKNKYTPNYIIYLLKNNRGEGRGAYLKGRLTRRFTVFSLCIPQGGEGGGGANKCTKKRHGRAKLCCFANLSSCLHYSGLRQCKELLES